jgi:hypothetical protein
MTRGSKALAAYRAGMLVGYVEAHPVAEALVPVKGDGFHVISCLRVPEAGERAEVEAALVHAAAEATPGSRGLALLAREKDWSALGFTDLEHDASEVESVERVLWWRPAAGGAAPAGPPPELVPVDRKLPKFPGKARVDLFWSDRCPWDRYVFDLVRDTCKAMKNDIVLFETDCTKRREVVRSGVSAAVAINGRFQPWLRPNRLPDGHQIRRTIESAV